MKGTYNLRKRNDTGLASPCVGCPHLTDCAKQHMACEQFSHWQDVGGRAWSKFPREPSRDIYNRIYNTRNAA